MKIDGAKEFEGRIALRPGEALYYCGISGSLVAARRTARNYLSDGKFPFKITKIGAAKVVLLADFYEALGIENFNSARILRLVKNVRQEPPP